MVIKTLVVKRIVYFWLSLHDNIGTLHRGQKGRTGIYVTWSVIESQVTILSHISLVKRIIHCLLVIHNNIESYSYLKKCPFKLYT